jgi:hypothetical protein
MPEPWERYSGSDEDPDLRTKRAIGKFVAGKKPNKKKKTDRKTIYRDDDGKPVSLETVDAMDRIQAANKQEAESLELSLPRAKPRGAEGQKIRQQQPETSGQRRPLPTIKQSNNQTIIRQAPRSTETDPRSTGALGPQRITPPLNRSAIELNRQQAETRLAEAADAGFEDGAPINDLPIEGGRVFLELEPQEPFITEGERELERQRKMLEVQRGLITPEGPRTGAPEAEAPQESGRAKTGIRRAGPPGMPAAAAQQIAFQAQLSADRAVEAKTREAKEQASIKERAAAARQRIGRLRQLGVLFSQAVAGGPAGFAAFVGTINGIAVKQYLAPKANIPPLFPPTSKPSLILTAFTVLLDLLLVCASLIVIVIPIALIITVVFASLNFSIFGIIYGIFAALFQ